MRGISRPITLQNSQEHQSVDCSGEDSYSCSTYNLWWPCVSQGKTFLKILKFRASLVAQWLKNLPANAGDTGSSPGLGRSHMPRSNWAREPQLLSLRVWSLCSATREAATVRGPCTAMKSGPCSPQLEKALAQKRRPNTAKNK